MTTKLLSEFNGPEAEADQPLQGILIYFEQQKGTERKEKITRVKYPNLLSPVDSIRKIANKMLLSKLRH